MMPRSFSTPVRRLLVYLWMVACAASADLPADCGDGLSSFVDPGSASQGLATQGPRCEWKWPDASTNFSSCCAPGAMVYRSGGCLSYCLVSQNNATALQQCLGAIMGPELAVLTGVPNMTEPAVSCANQRSASWQVSPDPVWCTIIPLVITGFTMFQA